MSISSRGDVVREIIRSEAEYIQNLQSLTEWYIVPIRDHPTKILDSSDIQQQFGYLEAIYGLHKNLYDSMQLAVKNANDNFDEVNMGPIFKKFSHFSRMYKTYLSTYEEALIKRGYLLTKNIKLMQLLDVIATDPRSTNLKPLEYLLEEPINRISRYRFLLEHLLALTAPIHYDYDSIIESLKIIKELDVVDPEQVSRRQNFEKILSIILSFDSKCRINLLDNTSRMYIRDALMYKQCRITKKEFHFWLFNDSLVYGERMPNGKYWLSHQIPLMNTRITPASNVEKEKYAFQISAPEKCFIVWGRSEQEKCDWLADLSYHSNYSRAKLKAETGHDAPAWVPDDANTECNLCKIEFTFIKRRHHCRHCGSIICGDCSRHRFLLPHIDKKPSRICDICHTKLATTNIQERKEEGKQLLNMAKSLFKATPSSPTVGPPPVPVGPPPAPIGPPPALPGPPPVKPRKPSIESINSTSVSNDLTRRSPNIPDDDDDDLITSVKPPPIPSVPSYDPSEQGISSNVPLHDPGEQIINSNSSSKDSKTISSIPKSNILSQPQVNKFLRRATALHKTQLVGGAGIKDSFSPSRDSAVRRESFGRDESMISELSLDMESIYFHNDRSSSFAMPSFLVTPPLASTDGTDSNDNIDSMPPPPLPVVPTTEDDDSFEPSSLCPPPVVPPSTDNPFGDDDEDQ